MAKAQNSNQETQNPADLKAAGVDLGAGVSGNFSPEAQREASGHNLDVALFQDDPRQTRKVWITVPRDGTPGALNYVSPAVNGVIIKVPRGERVAVPEAYVHALDLMIETHYHPDEKDPNQFNAVDAPSVPVQIHGYVD